MSLYDAHVARVDALRARAAAGDSRARAALDRLAAVPAQMEADRAAGPRPWPTITAWVATWPLGVPRGDDETVHAWAIRCCRDMGMSALEAVQFLAAAEGRR